MLYEYTINPKLAENKSLLLEKIYEAILNPNKELPDLHPSTTSTLIELRRRVQDMIRNPSRDTYNVVLNTILSLLEGTSGTELAPVIANIPLVYITSDNKLLVSIPPHSDDEHKQIREVLLDNTTLYSTLFNTYIKEITKRLVKVDVGKFEVKIGNDISIPLYLSDMYRILGELDLDDVSLSLFKHDLSLVSNLSSFMKGVSKQSKLKFRIDLDKNVLLKSDMIETEPEIFLLISPTSNDRYEGEINLIDEIAKLRIVLDERTNDLKILIGKLLNSLEFRIKNLYVWLRDSKNILEKNGFTWKIIETPEETGVVSEKRKRIGDNQVYTRIIITISSDSSRQAVTVKSSINIASQHARIRDTLVKIGEKDGWMVHTNDEVILEKTWSGSFIVKAVLPTIEKLRQVEEALNNGELVKEKEPTYEDYLILYMIKKLVTSNIDLEKITGEPEESIVNKAIMAIVNNKMISGYYPSDVRLLVTGEPKIFLREIINNGLEIDDTMEPVILGRHIEDSLSRFKQLRDLYSIDILSLKLKQAIYKEYYKITKKNLLDAVTLSDTPNTNLIIKLVKYGFPPTPEVLKKEVEGEPLWKKLPRKERTIILSKLSTEEIEALIKDGLIEKQELNEAIQQVCRNGNSSKCTELVAKYNPKLGGLPKNVKLIKINDEVFIDLPAYKLQVKEIGILNITYRVVSKVDGSETIVKARNPREAIYKTIKTRLGSDEQISISG